MNSGGNKECALNEVQLQVEAPNASERDSSRDRASRDSRAKGGNLPNGTRRSLDLGPSSIGSQKPQNRRYSDQMKTISDKNDAAKTASDNVCIFNGTSMQKIDKCGAHNKLYGVEDKPSPQNRTSLLINSNEVLARNRGLKHWFPGIKNTMT